MPKISYQQAQADHEYLWAIGAADDMTGAYVDQEDLAKLLAKPNRSTARDCYCSQIDFWFQKGPCPIDVPAGIPWEDETVREICRRHFQERYMPAEYKEDDDD